MTFLNDQAVIEFTKELSESDLGSLIEVTWTHKVTKVISCWAGQLTKSSARGIQIHFLHEQPGVLTSFPEWFAERSLGFISLRHIASVEASNVPQSLWSASGEPWQRAAAKAFSPRKTARKSGRDTDEIVVEDEQRGGQRAEASNTQEDDKPTHRVGELEDFQTKLLNKVSNALALMNGRLNNIEASQEENARLQTNAVQTFSRPSMTSNAARVFSTGPQAPLSFQFGSGQDVSYEVDSMAAAVNESIAAGSQKLLWLTQEIAVPLAIPERVRIFYPHLWTARVHKEKVPWSIVLNEWRNGVEAHIRSMPVKPNEVAEAMMFNFKQQFAAWLENCRAYPITTTEWRLPFAILRGLFLQMLLLEYKSDSIKKVQDRLEASVLIDYIKAAKDLTRRQA